MNEGEGMENKIEQKIAMNVQNVNQIVVIFSLFTSKCDVLWSESLSEHPICKQFFFKHTHRFGPIASHEAHGIP